MSAILENNIDTLISQHPDGYSLEQPFYCSDEVFQRDMDRLIGQRWLLVDHVSRIPNKGDYFLFDIGEESIIIIRQSDE
ncbi:MAG: aromatic ring-hydroxylating dioxygenase subunit alpha, partial [Gammaproteobacteria bacterium]|nr:aromatic ring-hydroxylating dioxygenase subunit alpha [Gammaproteobacteria bacterium]